MLFLITLAAAAVVGYVLWKVMTGPPVQGTRRISARPRVTAPEDDPEFLHQLGERLRGEGGDPPRRR